MSKQLEIDGVVINDIYDLAVAALNFGGADDANAFKRRQFAWGKASMNGDKKQDRTWLPACLLFSVPNRAINACLTQFRNCPEVCQIPSSCRELCDELRTDHRIPIEPHAITAASLPVFAEYQRRFDKITGFTPPPVQEDEVKAVLDELGL